MKKENELRIGLALNAIAQMLDDENYRKVKGRLDEIEQVVLEERNENNNAE